MKKKIGCRIARAYTLTFFFFVTLNITMRASDFSITYDSSYFNPLAVSFKWDIVLDKKFKIDKPFKIQYQLYSRREKKSIWLQTTEIRLKKPSFSIYLFFTDIKNKKSGPFIRVETIPSSNMTMFEIQKSRFSNSVLFTGKRKVNADFLFLTKLLSTTLLDSNQGIADENIFSRMFIPKHKETRTCNLDIDFSIKLIKHTIVSVPKIKDQ